jgi:hypothetical protein
MNITIIGTGNVGRALGTGWVKAGHAVVFGSREPNGEKAQGAVTASGGRAAYIGEAVVGAEVVVLAVPWPAVEPLLAEFGGAFAGKVLVDAVNPIAPGFTLALGHTTSGGEFVAARAPGAQVVKCFNTTGWENMLDPVYGGEPTAMFLCGDEAGARACVAQLARDLGFEPVDVGGLAMARHLEPLAMVWISYAIGQKQGRGVAFKIVRR